MAQYSGYPQEIGTLIAVLIKARNLPNRRTLGKQDPYCTLRVGQNAQSTKVDVRGGQRPSWNHELRYKLVDSDESMKLTVFDDNDSKPDLIGDTIIDLKTIVETCQKKEQDQWHTIQFRTKFAGEVYIEMTFYPNRDYVRHSLIQRAHAKQNLKKSVSTPSTPSTSGSPFSGSVRPLPVTPTASAQIIEDASYQTPSSQYLSPKSSLSSSPAPTPVSTRPAIVSESDPIIQFLDRSVSQVVRGNRSVSPLMPARANSQIIVGSGRSLTPTKGQHVFYGSENTVPIYPSPRTYSYDDTVLANVPDQLRYPSSGQLRAMSVHPSLPNLSYQLDSMSLAHECCDNNFYQYSSRRSPSQFLRPYPDSPQIPLPGGFDARSDYYTDSPHLPSDDDINYSTYYGTSNSMSPLRSSSSTSLSQHKIRKDSMNSTSRRPLPACPDETRLDN
ncbi:uncharacterized protein V1516DRAFT_710762 [Lipomyces oligophaga]|uniref:uncharacterized protein n=1 Tax=Lipomyces oligophaga TaxID=45792 RepID=UPI0034CE3152